MGDAPDNHALSERLAILEERMKTMRAENEGALDRLRADIAKNGIVQIAITITAIGIGVAFLGFLIRLPS